MNLNLQTLEAIKTRIDRALKEEFGDELEFGWDAGSYTSTVATLKLKVFAEGKETSARNDWILGSYSLGMDPDDFGRSFLCKGEKITITGIRPRATKYKIYGTRVSDGELRCYTVSTVKSGLLDKVHKPRIDDHEGVGLSAMNTGSTF